MDNEILVNKLSTIVNETAQENGDFSLFMLVANDASDIRTKYSLLVSAGWLDALSPKKGIEYIVTRLRKVLNSEDSTNISRVTIINSSDNFVKTINSTFQAKNTKLFLRNANVFGIQIDSAVLFESNRAS